MDTLRLSYEEVLHRIPYRNLVIMQKDKLRVCYGTRMVEVTEEAMFGGMGKGGKIRRPKGMMPQKARARDKKARGGTNAQEKE